MAGKTFQEKLECSNNLPKTQVLTDPRAMGRCGGARMPIAPPLAYVAVMKKVPHGRVQGEAAGEILSSHFGTWAGESGR